MPKLRIPIRVAVAFLGLAIALQAVVLFVEQLGHPHMADRMPLPAQFQSNGPRAFTNPAQRRFRITTRFPINQPIQRANKMRIGNGESLASATRATKMPRQRTVAFCDFAKALANRLAGQSASPVN